MSVIAEAFVRIRPDTAGFKSETEGHVRSAVAGVGKILAGAFAVKTGFDFAKDIVRHASDAQRATRGIHAEFGNAAKAVLDFGEHGATALGVSASLADTTAVKFGIIGKNIGLTHAQTATMTIGFEKLAGSIATIRNIDPEKLFANLPNAMAGNTRALRQLGITTDQSSLKIAAFKLGLTDSITQALTPAQKALAIYAIATANLGDYQKQASQHAGDLANVQSRLHAEWENSKDALGKGLLPVLASMTKFLADRLPPALEKVRSGFHTLYNIVHSVTGPIGGLKGAVEALIATFAIAKIAAFATAIRADLIANGTQRLMVAFQATKAEVVGAYSTMEIATVGLAATIKGALISTGIGAIAVAAGIAAQLVITHWGAVKKFFGDASGYIHRVFGVTWEAVKQGAKAAAYAMIAPFAFAIEKILSVASHLPFIGHSARKALNEIKGIVDGFRPDFSKVTAAWAAGGQHAGTAFSKAARKQVKGFESTFGGTLPALSALEGHPVNDAVSNAIAGRKPDPIAKAAAAAADATKAAVANLNDRLQQTVKENTDAIQKARQSLGQARQSLADAIRQQGVDVAQAVQDARSNLQTLGQGLASTVSTFIDNGPLAKQIQRLQDALTGRQQREQRKQLVAAVTAAQKTLRDNLAAIGTDPGRNPNERRAINEFLAPQRQSLAQARQALGDFDAQARIGGLQKRQQHLKDTLSRGFADLTDEFNHGAINASTFNTRIAGLLARGGITYKRAGKTLGVSFADGFRDQVSTILRQAFAIQAGPQLAGVGGTVVRPLEVLRRDQQTVARAQHQVSLKQTGLQERIAKAAEKQAQILEKIQAVQLGPTAKTVQAPGPSTDPRRSAARRR